MLLLLYCWNGGVSVKKLLRYDTAGRIYVGSQTPANGFRTAFKKMFTETYLLIQHALSYAHIVYHSWRKSVVSWLSVGSGL